jgi:hypothetical protein
MDREAAIRVIDPHNNEKLSLRRTSDHGVVSSVSSHLRRFESLHVSQRLGHLRARDSALGMVSLDVAKICHVPDYWAAVHPR